MPVRTFFPAAILHFIPKNACFIAVAEKFSAPDFNVSSLYRCSTISLEKPGTHSRKTISKFIPRLNSFC